MGIKKLEIQCFSRSCYRWNSREKQKKCKIFPSYGLVLGLAIRFQFEAKLSETEAKKTANFFCMFLLTSETKTLHKKRNNMKQRYSHLAKHMQKR